MYFNTSKENINKKDNIQYNNKWTEYNASQLAEKLNSDKNWYEDINSKKIRPSDTI